MEGDSAEVGRMQAGLRAWVVRAASTTRDVRGIAPTVLLSLLCASAFCPLLLPAVAGLGAAAVAGSGVLSSIGGGVLSTVITEVLDRARSKSKPRAPASAELEGEIAEEIGRVLATGDANAQALRGEIAAVLEKIDAGGIMVRAAMEQGNERIRGDLIAAIGVLGSDFAEMRFLVNDVARAAAEIQKSLDAQGADVRVVIGQNEQQSTDIRLIREDVAVIARRIGVAALTGGVGNGAAPRWARGCPYRGLLPFAESDAEVFYGRERLTAELAVKMAAQVSRGGFVVVTGASGAGKSSLLRAGLLPGLAQGRQVSGSEHWPRMVITPTKDPLTELAARLAALGGNDAVAVRDGLAQRPGHAHLAVWSAVLADAARRDDGRPTAGDSAVRLVLIVDQFEQVFTLNPGSDGEAERRAFITALCAAATNPVGPEQKPPGLVVIAVRGDFWDRCAAYPELAGALQEGQFVVGPMSESELRLAITGPADAAGLRIDPALTDTILSDLRATGGDDAAGVLPLLSQAMALTWDKREGDRLTSHGYGQVGGVSHAVQTSADGVYDALPPGHQTLAREILRSMTVASRDGRLTRRPVTRADLYTGHTDADRSRVDAVLEAFAAARLLVLDGGTAQISHDVLLSAWPRLRDWLADDRASWILYGQLADDAAAWHDGHDDPSFLYRGTQLNTLRQAATRWSADPARYPVLTDTQSDFLHASERAATRSIRQRRAAFVGLAVLVLVTLIALFAIQQRRVALSETHQAITSEVTVEAEQLQSANPSLAAQLSLVARSLDPSDNISASQLLDTANISLSNPLTGPTGPVWGVAFSPDGRILAAASSDGTVRLWSVTDTAHPAAIRPPLTGHNGPVYSVAFSPDGKTLAAGSAYGIRLWNVSDPAHATPIGRALTGLTGGVSAVAFSPDGHTLAAGSAEDDSIRLWNVTDPAHATPIGPLTGPTGGVWSVAFSPDGRTLATGGNDDTIGLWNVTDPAHATPIGQPLTGPTGPVFSVAFSPDQHTLAAGSGGDDAVRLWNVTNPAHATPIGPPLTGPTNTVSSVAFSPEGNMLAAASQDNTIRLWNVTNPDDAIPVGQPLTGSNGPIYSVAFSPDGYTLASDSGGDTARLWNLPSTILTGQTGTVSSVAFSPDGNILATGRYGDTTQLWNVTNPAHPTPVGEPLTDLAGSVLSVAFSPDGNILAVGSYGNTIQLWNVTDPAHATPIGQPLTGPTGPVSSVAFSPDGRTLAAGSWDGTIRLWNVTGPADATPVGQPLTGPVRLTGAIYAVAFSPDGRTLAAGNHDDTIQLWNVTDPVDATPIGQPLTGPTNNVFSVAYSPDGHTLAAGGADDTVRLWNVTDPADATPIGQPLTGATNAVEAVAFSPDGNTLAVGSGDGTIQLWNVADPADATPIGEPLTEASPIFSVAFSLDGHTLATGSGSGTTQLWNLNVDQAIERICATTSYNLTPQQWARYIPQLPYDPPCRP